jgi:hypothetical protein
MKAIGKINFFSVFLQQILHHEVMRRAADDTNIVTVCKSYYFFVIADEFRRLPRIPETGQAVGGYTGAIMLHYGNNGRHD